MAQTADDLLKAKLAEYLGHLETTVKAGGDFAAQQLPDVAHQIVAYNLAYSILMCIGSVIMIAVAAWVLRWMLKNPSEFEGGLELVPVIPVVIAFVGVGVFCEYINDVLMCWLAPKYFVLQEILRMAKGG